MHTAAAPVPPPKGEYMFGLDAVRFFAALVVCVFHLTWHDPRVAETAWYGWVGVQIFFVISGLVIANSAQGRASGAFLRARVLRLYPAAWVCAFISLAPLVIAGVLQTSQRGFYGLEALATMLLSSLTLVPFGSSLVTAYLTTAYWTLPIELVFYGLIFLLLATGSFDKVGRLAIGLCVASSAYLSAYGLHVIGVIQAPWLEFGYGLANLTLLRHGVYFGLGILIWMWSQKRLTRLGGFIIALSVVSAVIEIGCRSVEIAAKSPANPTVMEVWGAAAMVWFVAGGVILASIKWAGPIAKIPPRLQGILRVAGLSSYPLYLIHENVGRAPKFILTKMGVDPLVAVAAGSLVAVVISIVVARYLEPAVRDWLDRVWVKQKKMSTAASA